MIQSTFPVHTEGQGLKPDFIDPAFYQGREIPLPKPAENLYERDFTQLSKKRKSGRAYSKVTMTQKQLSHILYYSYHLMEDTRVHLPVPTACNGRSLRLYLCILNVLDLEKGIYKYHPKNHSLFLVQRFSDAEEDLQAIFLKQNFLLKASCLLALGAHLPSASYKYPSEAEKFILLEAGHVGQQIQLAAESLNLASCPVAKYDQALADAFFQAEETPISYVFSLGTRGGLG